MKIFSFITIILYYFMFSTVNGQYIMIFENVQAREKIEVETGDYLKIEYRGYLGQKQSVKNYISSISGSGLTIVSNSDKDISNDFFKIRGDDISGFRKMWKIQPLIKPLSNLGLTVGSYFFFENNKHISEGEAILYSIGTGIVFNYLLGFLFPEDIEYRIVDGWTVKFSPKINP